MFYVFLFIVLYCIVYYFVLYFVLYRLYFVRCRTLAGDIGHVT